VSELILKCVECGIFGLARQPEQWACTACGARFPIVRNISRFVQGESYAQSFGFQWQYFSQTQLDSSNGRNESRDTFVEKTGLSLEQLQGKRILDVGCGMGRFAEVCADAGAEVHAIDLSAAVESAAKNLGERPGVFLYQADIMRLPFVDNSFDLIYSIGVLHHTSSTRVAFSRLPPLLKPGGTIAIWVYSKRSMLCAGGEVLRLVTPSLPTPWLLGASRIARPLYYLHRLPVLGDITRAVLPTSMHPDPEWRVLDTFDWYSPKYQWKHTFTEVKRWFRDAGLVDIETQRVPVSVKGTKPDARAKLGQ